MKRFTILLMLVLTLFVSTGMIQGRPFVDIRPVRPITSGFFEVISQKNIRVFQTFKCGTNFRADWENATFVKLTGSAYVWTDSYGVAHIHLMTADPPMVLNGLRAPMTLNTAPTDMDGNVVIGDQGYWVQYLRWREKPCVDFRLSLLSQKGFADAWRYWLKDRKIEQYQEIWKALDLDGRTGMPDEFINTYTTSIELIPEDPTLVQPNWKGDGIAPDFAHEPGGEWYEFDKQGIPLWLYGAGVLLALGLLFVLIKRSKVKDPEQEHFYS